MMLVTELSAYSLNNKLKKMIALHLVGILGMHMLRCKQEKSAFVQIHMINMEKIPLVAVIDSVLLHLVVMVSVVDQARIVFIEPIWRVHQIQTGVLLLLVIVVPTILFG